MVEELLSSAVQNSLLEADRLGVKSLSIPAISSGVFGVPKKICAKVMINAIDE